jgi:kexin
MEKLSGPIDTDIPNGDVGVSHSIQITDEDIKSNKLKRLEHVTITVKIDHQRRGDISIHLISPNNFVSRMVEARSRDDNTEGYDEWAMMSVAFWYYSIN